MSKAAQADAVGDHKNAAKGHGTSRQHGVKQSYCRCRDQDGVVKESPEQVLLDRSEGLP